MYIVEVGCCHYHSGHCQRNMVKSKKYFQGQSEASEYVFAYVYSRRWYENFMPMDAVGRNFPHRP